MLWIYKKELASFAPNREEVSRGSLLQDQFLERQVRHSLAQPIVLFLKLLETLHLITLLAAELFASPVIRELRHADRANCFAN